MFDESLSFMKAVVVGHKHRFHSFFEGRTDCFELDKQTMKTLTMPLDLFIKLVFDTKVEEDIGPKYKAK